MIHMKKSALLIAICAAVCALILCLFFLSKRPFSSSAVSVEEFIDSRNGDLGVEDIIALTTLNDEFDLVFYMDTNNQVSANLLVKSEDGTYTGFVMTTSQSLDRVNRVTGSSDLLYLSENTLYWGIAQSPDWVINHSDSHQIVADDLTLAYYFHNKSSDEEILDLEFVYNGD